MKRWKKFDLDEMISADQAERAAARQRDAVNVADQVERFAMALKDGVSPEQQAYMAGVLEGMLSAMALMQRSA